MTKIAFIGLGVMGRPMVRHLRSAGHELRLYSRRSVVADELAQELGAVAFPSMEEAVSGADVLIICVGNDDDVRSVVDATFPHLSDNAVFIDHSTISAKLAAEIAENNPRLLCVDAPVSGGQAGAEQGQLAAMCGGSEEAFARAEPLIAAYAKKIVRIGPAGHGQLAKMSNQLAIAGVIQGLAEALHFADKAGVDHERLLEAIGGGAAQSWQMDNRAKTMIEGKFDFGFAVDLMRKDLGLVLDAARANGASLPVAALVDQFYADLQKMGSGSDDTSSLIRRLA